jgi:competence protein ComEC
VAKHGKHGPAESQVYLTFFCQTCVIIIHMRLPPITYLLLVETAGILTSHITMAPLWLWWCLAGMMLLLFFSRPLRFTAIFAFFFFLSAFLFQAQQRHAPSFPQKHRVALHKNIFETQFFNTLPTPYSAIAVGIFFGDHRDIPQKILSDFQVTGTYHLLVASGLKVGMVAAGTWLFSRWLPFFTRIVLSGLTVLLYSLLAGLNPPLLRASIMAFFFFASIWLGRGKNSLNAFFWSAFLLLIFNPSWLFEAGFQLSFLSVLGIFLFYDTIKKHLNFLPKLPSQSISITLSTLFPIVIPLAIYFHNISFVSLAANLFTVPLVGLSLFFGTASLLANFFLKSISHAFVFWHLFILKLLLLEVEFFSKIPLAYRWVSSPSPPTILGYYLALLGFWLWLSNLHAEEGKILLTGASLFLLFLAVFRFFKPLPNEVVFLNVGQGDCEILRLGKKIFLMDGGGSHSEIYSNGYSVGEKITSPFLESLGANAIDGILLTHPHADHVGGLIAVLEHFHVKQIWLPKLESSSPIYQTFLKTAYSKKIPIIFVRGNEKILLAPHVWLYLYWPIPPFLHGTVSDLNNNSVVSQLVIGHLKILFSADVEKEAEADLLLKVHPKEKLWSQILKAPHHGSATSSTPDFLKAVSPMIAVVSVGKHNLYHQPSKTTLKRLRKISFFVYRTDQNGTIVVKILSTRFHPRIQIITKPIPQ